LGNENARYFDISSLHIPADLHGKDLVALQAIGSVFSGDKVDNVDFSGSNLLGTTFRQVAISNCNFHHARVDLARFFNSTVKNCDFSHAKFQRVQLQDVDPLTGIIRASKFVECKFSAADLSFVNFSSQDLTNTDFSSATLIGASFGHSEVGGADFTNCDMRGADMTRIDPRLLKSCQGALFDDNTMFHLPDGKSGGLNWTAAQLQEIKDMWRSYGARHINDT
jgi:uncharacterized protein YjbI with pentapeptide repeats